MKRLLEISSLFLRSMNQYLSIFTIYDISIYKLGLFLRLL